MIASLQKIGLKLSSLGILIVLAVCLAELMLQFGVACSIVNGNSMFPTLHDGDRLLVNKFQFLWQAPSTGDVITFQDPMQPNHYLVKRVVGVPGDVIEIRSGVVKRNGKKLKENYIDTQIQDGNYGPVHVKEKTVFVMGDNRHRYASRDSRYQSIGLVPFRLIDGKVEWILWR